MNTSTSVHKLTVFSQLLSELQNQADEMQIQIIKAASADDLRLMLLGRYPLKLTVCPDTMTALIREVESLLPDIKRIIEK